MKKFQNDDLVGAIIYFLIAFSLVVISLVCFGCRKMHPPIEPSQKEIQDSIKLEIADKKTSYILQKVREK